MMDVEDKTRVVVPPKKAELSQKPGQKPGQKTEDATVFSPSIRAVRNSAPIVDGMVAASKPAAARTSSAPDATVFAQASRPAPTPNSDATVFNHSAVQSAQSVQQSLGRSGIHPIVSASSDNGTVTESVTKTVIKGRFELDKLLGVGGMGAVYKALDRRKVEASDSDPYVAIKVLNDDFKQHPDAFVSLQREARKSQTLAHPNIVTVFDFDRDAEMVFMTMEFLDGLPLDELLREHQDVGLEEDEAYKILNDISQALIYAHSHGIVHSDFKPGNIFATKSKGAKVFDFGIARAVSAGGMGDVVGEQTLFDAGSLGALTPAYASMEMLLGEEPSPSDDVYALGCVAYELYTGRHPFKKVPADKAFAQKLKPKRIKCLSRRQWRALEAALEFSRDKRTATVEEFVGLFFGRGRTIWLAMGVAIISISALAAAYYLAEQAAVDDAYRLELQKNLEIELLQSRIADKKEELLRLLARGTLTVDWERDIKSELAQYAELAPEDEALQETIRRGIVDKFVAAAADYLQGAELNNAEAMLARAGEWETLSDQANAILSGVNEQREEIARRLEIEKLEAERKVIAAQRAQARAAAAAEARARSQKLEVTISAIESSLGCDYGMDISGALADSLAGLNALDSTKHQQIRPVVASELNRCIKKLALDNPKRAAPLLKRARALLPEQTLLGQLKIDYCGHLKAGSGGRGSRYSCQDLLARGGLGPEMVVTTGAAKKPIAIGKYEISFADLSLYCNQTSACKGIQMQGDKPVHDIPLAVAEGYIAWLSQQTGYSYRLPSHREWFAAASANGEREQADRNCHLKYGGIEKGTELVDSGAGKGNRYGLVNHVGNVQEWVYGDSKQLMVAGGSRQDSMSQCLSTTQTAHDGSADIFTGFRVARDINK